MTKNTFILAIAGAILAVSTTIANAHTVNNPAFPNERSVSQAPAFPDHR